MTLPHSGWLRWGGKNKAASSKERVQLSSNLPMSTNVPDGRRTVSSITVSPLGNLAAAVDCFGRVLLLECESLVIRRMWKGGLLNIFQVVIGLMYKY